MNFARPATSPPIRRARSSITASLCSAPATSPAASHSWRRRRSSIPRLPHTWFNLGITFKKQAEFDRALPQFQQMARLVPNEPVTHYQLGALHKLANDLPAAIAEFERARDLNPRLAAPHFQLYGLYRQANRPEDAAAELAKFQDLKKQQEGAAVPEDMEWSFYSEIYDAPPAPPPAPAVRRVYRRRATRRRLRRREPRAQSPSSLDGGVRPSLIAWGNGRAALFRNGTKAATDSGLEDLRDVVSIAAGDFDNDGLPDLAVVTTARRSALPQRRRPFPTARRTGARLVPQGRLARLRSRLRSGPVPGGRRFPPAAQ